MTTPNKSNAPKPTASDASAQAAAKPAAKPAADPMLALIAEKRAAGLSKAQAETVARQQLAHDQAIAAAAKPQS